MSGERKGQPRSRSISGSRRTSPLVLPGSITIWISPEGEPRCTSTIVTTGANELLMPIHDRMPVITPADKYDLWLNPGVRDHAALQEALLPYPSGEMELFPVTPRMNSVARDSPDNIRPM